MNNPRPNPNAYIVLGAVFLVLAAVNGYLAWISPAESRSMKIAVAVVFVVLGVLRILRGVTAKRLP